MDIKKNILFFQKDAAAAGARLIAVSKTHPAEKIKEAYDAGQRIFGENKVQELTAKQTSLPSDIEWHMIGHLQSNKVKTIVPFISLIHSVDSLRLISEIDKEAKKIGRVVSCLLQIHIASEETKFGFDEQELMAVISSGSLASFHSVHVRGLMGMATLTDDTEKIRHEFRLLKNLFENVKKVNKAPNVQMAELSMGMSADYKIALEEGSTLVRVGTAIFGGR